MAKPFEPVTFVKTGDDGEERELTASTPADAVRLKFDGWRAKTAKAPARAGARPATTAGSAG